MKDDSNGPPSLQSARDQIDALDRELIQLLAQRLQVVRAVADSKQQRPGQGVRDREREREVFQAWAREAQKVSLSPYFTSRILRELLNWSRRDQEASLGEASQTSPPQAIRVGYQGVAGSNSDLALTKLFSQARMPVRRQGYASFTQAVEALQSGALERAFLPLENSIVGSIHEVYELVREHRLSIVAEESWRVEHCLLGLRGSRLEEIRLVRSHPVALQQCRRYLQQWNAVLGEAAEDTAGAAAELARSDRRDIAVIAPEEAAELYGLEVLARSIADQPHNYTRFALLACQPSAVDLRFPAKTSLYFTLSHRRGALHACLGVLDRHDLNLTKIESRPQPLHPWEYAFYADFEGNLASPEVAQALTELAAHTHSLQVLGCYPRRIDQAGELEALVLDSLLPGSLPATAGASARVETGAPKTANAPAKTDALRLVRRKAEESTRPVSVGPVEIGGNRFVLIAGPCAIESRHQLMESAQLVRDHGARMLRGGAFKPRTSPYEFQGLGFEGVTLLAETGRALEMPTVTEVLRPEDVAEVAERTDMLQIAARNMQNFALLRAVGRTSRPVLLKRGHSATIQELLLAAEYIMAEGNQRVVLCERGIRTFETATRNTLDVSAVPVLKERTHLPVIVDPSHAAGVRRLVVPLALAAAAAGADGLIVEAHFAPDQALCDKDQALTALELTDLWTRLAAIVPCWGKSL